MLLSREFLVGALPQVSLFVIDPHHALRPLTHDDSFLAQDEEVSVAVDSRLLGAGELFVALVGQKVDGHTFLPAAAQKGAAAFMVSDLAALAHVDPAQHRSQLVIKVDDTATALVALASAWRSQLTVPVVAITGSVGKTTTKEMMRAILEAAGVPAIVSRDNQNTVVGICMNLLAARRAHRAVVLEVGISLKGEMAERIAIARPTIAAITTVGNTHAEGLGGIAGVAQEKRQIFKFFDASCIGIINGDKELLTAVHYPHPIAKFGLKTKNQVQARKITCAAVDGELRTSFTLKWYNQKTQVTIASGNQGYVSNALAAATIAYFLHIPLEAVVRGLEGYRGFAGRFELKAIAGNKGKLISDCYNASPESMRAAIKAFDAMIKSGKKIAVLGDMLELGDREQFWHRQLGRFVAKAATLDAVILVGQRARAALKTLPYALPVRSVESWREAIPALQELLEHDSLVLVKASRGMELTEMVKHLVQEGA